MGCGGNRPVQQTRLIRVALIGPPRSGKTSLLASYLAQRFQPNSTQEKGPSIAVKAYYSADTVVTLEVWEMQEGGVLPVGTNHAIVAVDCSQPIENVKNHIQILRNKHGFSSFTVAITKTDLLADCKIEEFISALRTELDLSESINTYPTSALEGTGIRTLFSAYIRPVALTLPGSTGSEPL